LSIRNFLRIFSHIQLMPVLESGEETLVGGQAVIEGVMMRTPHSYCVAVRRPNGQLITEEKPLPRVSEKYPIFRLPVLRGVGTLGQAMSLGVKALRFSANAALEDADPNKKANAEPISKWAMAAHLAFSLTFFVALYKFVPLWMATALGEKFALLDGRFAFNLTDGMIRLLIFLVFLGLVSRMRDIRRVFEYHGAEHRVVFNFESGKPINVANAQNFATFHPRCGTSFLLVVMVISIGVYTLVPFDSFTGRFLSRVVLLPVIAGLSYELIRFAAKRQGGFLSFLTAPGLWLQRITTQPPAAEQTEVAIRALDGAMELEKQQDGQLVIA
jgi:uncharacterized protein YqhQ